MILVGLCERGHQSGKQNWNHRLICRNSSGANTIDAASNKTKTGSICEAIFQSNLHITQFYVQEMLTKMKNMIECHKTQNTKYQTEEIEQTHKVNSSGFLDNWTQSMFVLFFAKIFSFNPNAKINFIIILNNHQP